MTTRTFVANFSLTETARAFLSELKRQQAMENPGQPMSALSIGWGYERDADGNAIGEGVYVGGYPQSMQDEISDAVQTVSGIEFIYFVTEKEHAIFSGRILDYTKRRGLHLR